MPKKKAKDRQGVGEKTEGTVSRRTVLKIGAVAGAATVLAPTMLTSNTGTGLQQSVPTAAGSMPTVPGPESGTYTFYGLVHGSVSSDRPIL